MSDGGFSEADIARITEFFAVGRQFSVTNPGYYVQSDTCTVEAFAFPEVRLVSDRHNIVDAAYMHYTSTEELVGEVISLTEKEITVRFKSSYLPEKGLVFQEEEATYLLE